jgi:hypothetical protein
MTPVLEIAMIGLILTTLGAVLTYVALMIALSAAGGAQAWGRLSRRRRDRLAGIRRDTFGVRRCIARRGAPRASTGSPT